jgi:hypothetical protein
MDKTPPKRPPELKVPAIDPERVDWLAGLGVAVGCVLMFTGIFYTAEEGSSLRSWDEIRFGRRLFYAGAATALIAPVLVYLAGRIWMRRARRGKPDGWDDLA